MHGITVLILTALKTGAKMTKATSQRATITITVLLRLNTRRNAIGFLIARYLSMLIAVIVKTEAATATPAKYFTLIDACIHTDIAVFLNQRRRTRLQTLTNKTFTFDSVGQSYG